MLKQKRGQVAIVAFMLAVVVIILALAWAKPVNEITTNAMANSSNASGYDFEGNAGTIETIGMECTGSIITDFTKASCWVVDIGQGFYLIALLSFAGVIIAARLVFGGAG